MVNLEKILQGLLYLLGLIYFIKDALDNYKKHDFRCLLNKAYFVTGILGGIFSMLALSYLLFFYLEHGKLHFLYLAVYV